MTYCSKFNSRLLLLCVRWVFDLFLSIFQLIETIFSLESIPTELSYDAFNLCFPR